MPHHLVLLTGAREAPHLSRYLGTWNPGLRIEHAETVGELEAFCRPGTLLIAFLTSVIVPAAVLEKLGRPAYNFHPGPPTCPGRYPESFAAYRGDERFGATAHVMTRRVDEGPIVGVEWFDVPPGTGQMALADLAYGASVRLFGRLGRRLAVDDAPLPVEPLSWSGRKTTRAEYDALCELTPDIDAQEFARRLRGFGDNPDQPLFLRVQGRRFVLAPRREEPGEGEKAGKAG
jgi:methionyl-tRNA formyltransferase